MTTKKKVWLTVGLGVLSVFLLYFCYLELYSFIVRLIAINDTINNEINTGLLSWDSVDFGFKTLNLSFLKSLFYILQIILNMIITFFLWSFTNSDYKKLKQDKENKKREKLNKKIEKIKKKINYN